MDLLDCTRPRSTGRGSKRRLSYRCIFPNCGYTRMAAGSVLRMGGGQADRAYVLESGELEVRKHDPNGTEEVLALLWPAIGWGEMSPLLNVPQSGSVVAVRDSQLRRVTSANFAYAIKDHPEETLRLLKQLFERSSRANDKLVFRKYLPRIRGHSFRGFGCCFLLDQVSSKGPENDPRMHHAGRQREQPVYKITPAIVQATRVGVLKSLPTAMLQEMLVTFAAPVKKRFARLTDRPPRALPNSTLCSGSTDIRWP
jgi:CRP-like cAMP-binding protein